MVTGESAQQASDRLPKFGEMTILGFITHADYNACRDERPTVRPRMACAPKPHRPQVPHGGDVVYFLRIEETGDIKIGTTGQFQVRVNALRKQYGTVTLLATEPGYLARETEVHRRFQSDRIDQNREIFRPSDKLLAYIGHLAFGEEPICYWAPPPISPTAALIPLQKHR